MNLKLFPIIQTERLLLRKLTELDKVAIFKLRSDARVNKYLDRPLPLNMDEATAFINKINNSIEQNDCFYWAISLQNNAELIGTICLWNFSDDQLNAELGYELSPNFHGQGIMNEAIKQVIQYAFEIIGLKLIDAYPHKDNESSIKLLKKNGFTWQADKIDEDNLNYIIYSCYAEVQRTVIFVEKANNVS